MPIFAGATPTCIGWQPPGWRHLHCWGHHEDWEDEAELTESELPRAEVGAPYAYRLETNSEQHHCHQFSVSLDGLPDGLFLDDRGNLSGTPTAAGDFAFTVLISAGYGRVSEQEVTLEIVGSPTPEVNPAVDVTSSAAELSGSVDPRNLPTEAWFEYWPADTSSESASRTPTVTVAKGLAPVDLAASIAGLAPGTEYLFRLTAVNELDPEPVHSATLGLASAAPPASPIDRTSAPPLVPTAGENFNVETVGGTVTTKCPTDQAFNGLVKEEQVPVGCLIDTTRGTVRLTASKGGGETQTAYFWGGLFRVSQNTGMDQTAVLKLDGQLRCEQRAANGSRVQRRRGGGGRKLWGSGEGNYKTIGRHGAATVRGTVWLVQDRCDGSTLIKVKTGTVWIRDFVKGVKVVLREGESYVIEPLTPRLGK